MSNYNGIFLRSALGQDNAMPRQGAQNMSPDILTLGIEPAAWPAVFPQNYNAEFKKPLLAQQANYIYLRGKNYANQTIDNRSDSRPRLFWTKASLLLWPQTWTEINTSPSDKAWGLKAEPGIIGVTDQPYIWVPDNIANDHYCLIAMVPSPDYDNKIPDGPIADFNAWAAAHGGIACTGVEVVNAEAMTISQKAMPFEMGDKTAEVWLSIVCNNLPVGSTLSFSAGMPGTSPAIYMPPTTVSTSPKFSAGVKCNIKAGYESDIYFNLVVPAGNIANASVKIVATYAEEDSVNSSLTSEEFTF